MHDVDMGLRNAPSRHIFAAIMLPDQAERAIGLAIVPQRRAALVVIEYPRRSIISAADVIDNAIRPRGDPFGGAAAHDPRLRKYAGQNDAGEQLIGMKATGMG